MLQQDRIVEQVERIVRFEDGANRSRVPRQCCSLSNSGESTRSMAEPSIQVVQQGLHVHCAIRGERRERRKRF